MFRKTLVCVCGIMAWCGCTAINADSNAWQEQLFDADKLEVNDLNAVLTVRVKTQDGVSVAMKGPQQLVENIELDLHDDTLRVHQQKTPSLGNISATTINHGKGNSHSVVSINGQTIVVRGSGVTVVEHSPQERVSIDITVPQGTPMSFAGLKGDADIGDVLGPLVLETSGDVRVGRVATATVDVSRSGDVHIQQVAEQLDLNVSGNGEARISDGNVDHLTISVTDNGEAEFDGSADNAYLSATDNGDLTVAHVVNKPKIHTSRNADINVANW